MMDSTFFTSHARPRTWYSILVLATLIVLLAACGSTTSGSGTASSTGGTAPTSSGYGYGGYGHSGGTTPTTSSSGSLIKTATATVNGKSVTILTNAQGLTLYYRTSDVPPSTVCSGGCAGVWPPLVASGSAAPTSVTSLSGKLSVVADANGNQVVYNGHPLYTYSGDSGPAQTNGEGIGGIWHVVTPALS
jgi:predicted lipoprotein with Yx(FWY)xxD motif